MNDDATNNQQLEMDLDYSLTHLFNPYVMECHLCPEKVGHSLTCFQVGVLRDQVDPTSIIFLAFNLCL